MYLITYIIDESGYDFLRRNDISSNNESFFEGKCLDEYIDLELSEELTIFTIGIKYGWFSIEEKPKKRVLNFEKKLSKLVKCKVFYRVSETLIEKYSTEVVNDEFWYKKEKAFEDFSKWIETQEEFYWYKILSSKYEFQPANRIAWLTSNLNPDNNPKIRKEIDEHIKLNRGKDN